MKTFVRLIQSTRVWTAFVGLLTVIAVQCGMPPEKANALSVAVLTMVTVLIGSLTVRGLTTADPASVEIQLSTSQNTKEETHQ